MKARIGRQEKAQRQVMKGTKAVNKRYKCKK